MSDDLIPAAPPTSWLDEFSQLLATAPANLVSRGDRASVREVHVDESVSIARALRVAAGSRWMDLGTGGGLPGLVLAKMFPDTRWVLVDARRKKIDLVGSFAATLGLDNVDVVHGRAEDLARSLDMVAAFDGVISRAVGSLVATAVLARPFVAHGEIVAIRGPRATHEVDAAATMWELIDVVVADVPRVPGTMRPTWVVRLAARGPVPTTFIRTHRRLLRANGGGHA